MALDASLGPALALPDVAAIGHFGAVRGIGVGGLTHEPARSKQRQNSLRRKKLQLYVMLGGQEEAEGGAIAAGRFSALSLEMTGKIGPRAFDQVPEPARRLPADPCRFAEREADRLDQDQRFALLGSKLGERGENIGVLDTRPSGRRYRRAACIFAVVVAAQALISQVARSVPSPPGSMAAPARNRVTFTSSSPRLTCSGAAERPRTASRPGRNDRCSSRQARRAWLAAPLRRGAHRYTTSPRAAAKRLARL